MTKTATLNNYINNFINTNLTEENCKEFLYDCYNNKGNGWLKTEEKTYYEIFFRNLKNLLINIIVNHCTSYEKEDLLILIQTKLQELYNNSFFIPKNTEDIIECILDYDNEIVYVELINYLEEIIESMED